MPPISPDQLQWVLDHNMQIRGSHRVQIAEAVQAWRADQADLDAAEQYVKSLREEIARLAPKGTDADPERSDYTDPDDE